MKKYISQADFENKMRPYFIGDEITQSEFDTLTQNEKLNFIFIDEIDSLFLIEYYD